MNAGALLDDLQRRGATASVTPAGKLRIEPAAVVDDALLRELREQRDAIVAELRQRLDLEASRNEEPQCGDHLLTYAAKRGLYNAEWRVAGCPAFTVLERADKLVEARYGLCLSCGAPWPMHGSPVPDEWRCVKHPDDVRIVAIRFVIALETAIAQGSEQ